MAITATRARGRELRAAHQAPRRRGTSTLPVLPFGFPYQHWWTLRLTTVSRDLYFSLSSSSSSSTLEQAYDIANLSYVELPEHYQVSNAHAASSACGEVVYALAAGRQLDAAFIEDASCEQHKVWIADNSTWAAAEQLVAYEQVRRFFRFGGVLYGVFAVQRLCSSLSSCPTLTRHAPSSPLPARAQLSEPEKQKDRDIIVVAIASYDQSAASTPAGIAGIASSADEIKQTATELGKSGKMQRRRHSAAGPGIRSPPSGARGGRVRHSLSHTSSASTPAERAQAQAVTLWTNAVSAALHAIANAVSVAVTVVVFLVVLVSVSHPRTPSLSCTHSHALPPPPPLPPSPSLPPSRAVALGLRLPIGGALKGAPPPSRTHAAHDGFSDEGGSSRGSEKQRIERPLAHPEQSLHGDCAPHRGG